MALSGGSWGTREELLHPRDRRGRFRRKWSLPEGTVDKIMAVLDRFQPRRFQSQQQASQWAFNHANKAPTRFESFERLGADFTNTNNDLRAGKMTPSTQRFVTAYDKSAHPSAEDMVVYRRVGPEAFGLTPEQMVNPEGGIEDLLTGTTIVDKGYTSGNVGAPIGSAPITMAIAVPKGTKMLAPGRSGGDPQVILDRDQKLHVSKVEPDGQGGFQVMAILTEETGPETHEVVARGQAPGTEVREADVQDLNDIRMRRMGMKSDEEVRQEEAQRQSGARAEQVQLQQEQQRRIARMGGDRPAPQPAGGPPPRTEPLQSEMLGGRPAPTAPTPEESEDVRITDFREAFRAANIEVPSSGPRRREFNKAYSDIINGKRDPEDVLRELEADIRDNTARMDEATTRETPRLEVANLEADIQRQERLADLIAEQRGLERRAPEAGPPKPREGEVPEEGASRGGTDISGMTEQQKQAVVDRVSRLKSEGRWNPENEESRRLQNVVDQVTAEREGREIPAPFEQPRVSGVPELEARQARKAAKKAAPTKKAAPAKKATPPAKAPEDMTEDERLARLQEILRGENLPEEEGGEEGQLESMTRVQLVDEAKRRGIDRIPNSWNKTKIKDAIRKGEVSAKAAPATKATSAEATEAGDLDNMLKKDLIAEAAKRDVEVKDWWTKDRIKQAIRGEAPQAPRKAAKRTGPREAPLPGELNQDELKAMADLSRRGRLPIHEGGWVRSADLPAATREQMDGLAGKGWVERRASPDGDFFRIDPDSVGARQRRGARGEGEALEGDVLDRPLEAEHRQTIHNLRDGSIIQGYRDPKNRSMFGNTPETGADPDRIARIRVIRKEPVNAQGEKVDGLLNQTHRIIVGRDLETGRQVRSGPESIGSAWNWEVNPDVDVPSVIEGEARPTPEGVSGPRGIRRRADGLDFNPDGIDQRMMDLLERKQSGEDTLFRGNDIGRPLTDVELADEIDDMLKMEAFSGEIKARRLFERARDEENVDLDVLNNRMQELREKDRQWRRLANRLRGRHQETGIDNPAAARKMTAEDRKASFNDAFDRAFPILTPDTAARRSILEIRDDVAAGRLTPDEGVRRLESDIEFNKEEMASIDADLRATDNPAEIRDLRRMRAMLADDTKQQEKASAFMRRHFRQAPDVTPGEVKQALPTPMQRQLDAATPAELKQTAEMTGLPELRGDTREELQEDLLSQLAEKVKADRPAKVAPPKPPAEVISTAPDKKWQRTDISALAEGLDLTNPDDQKILKGLQDALDSEKLSPAQLGRNLQKTMSSGGGLRGRAALARSSGDEDGENVAQALERRAIEFEKLGERLQKVRRKANKGPEAPPPKPEVSKEEQQEIANVSELTGIPAEQLEKRALAKKEADAPPRPTSVQTTEVLDTIDNEQEQRALLSKKLKAELVDIAKADGIKVLSKDTKPVIIGKILDKRKTSTPTLTPAARPDTGPDIEVVQSLKELTPVQIAQSDHLTEAGRKALDGLGPEGHPRIAAISDPEEKIRESYRILAMPGGGMDSGVAIADIRKLVGDQVSRKQLDDTFREMDNKPDVNLTPQSYARGNAATRIPAAVMRGGQEQNILYINDPSLARVSQFPAVEMAEELVRRRRGESGNPMMAKISTDDLRTEVADRARRDKIVAQDLTQVEGWADSLNVPPAKAAPTKKAVTPLQAPPAERTITVPVSDVGVRTPRNAADFLEAANEAADEKAVRDLLAKRTKEQLRDIMQIGDILPSKGSKSTRADLLDDIVKNTGTRRPATAPTLPTPTPTPAKKATPQVPRTPEQRFRNITNDKIQKMSDEQLLELFEYESRKDVVNEERIQFIYDEMGRRETASELEAAQRLEAEAPMRERLDELIEGGMDYRDAYAEAFGQDPEELERQERRDLIDRDRMPGESREQAVRRAYQEQIAISYVQAEAATNGHMLTPAGVAAGIDPYTLFSGPRSRANKWASDELKEWWERNGRLTYVEFRGQVMGGREGREAVRRGRESERGFL